MRRCSWPRWERKASLLWFTAGWGGCLVVVIVVVVVFVAWPTLGSVHHCNSCTAWPYSAPCVLLPGRLSYLLCVG